MKKLSALSSTSNVSSEKKRIKDGDLCASKHTNSIVKVSVTAFDA